MTTVTLTLPFPDRLLHPNARPFWATKARITKTYREQAWYEGKNAGIRLAPPVTATVTFYVKDKRRHDEDGLLASMKAAFDGLVDSGLLEDDSSDKLHIVNGGVVVGEERCVKVVLS